MFHGQARCDASTNVAAKNPIDAAVNDSKKEEGVRKAFAECWRDANGVEKKVRGNRKSATDEGAGDDGGDAATEVA